MGLGLSVLNPANCDNHYNRMVKPYLVPSIKRAFQILDLLSEHEAGLTLSDLHRELKFPLSSTATILYTLQALGYVEREPETSRYRLGIRVLAFSRRALDQIGMVARCHPLIEQLVKDCGLTAHLAILRDGNSIYIDRVCAPGLIQFSSYIGMRWPAHASAVGKALLTFMNDADREAAFEQLTLKKITDNTVTSKDVLLQQLRTFRKLGYAWEIGEGDPAVGCVAAPVFGTDKVLAAVSVTGTTQQITKNRVTSLGPLIRQYCHQMSERLASA